MKELDKLLGEDTVEQLLNVPVNAGIELVGVLNNEVRPQIIKYVTVLHKAGRYIEMDLNSRKYKLTALEATKCEDIMVAIYGACYLTALERIEQGICEGESITQYINDLYNAMKITNNYNGLIRLAEDTVPNGITK